MNKLQKDTLKQFASVLNITEDELIKVLKIFDSGQKDIQKLIVDVFSKYGSSDGEKFYRELKKYNRLKDFEKSIGEVAKEIGTKEIAMTALLLSEIYKQSYYRNAYVLDINLTTKVNFSLIRKEVIQAAIEYPVEGLTFSERIWVNQQKLQQNLKATLINGITKGKDIKTMTKELSDVMNTGRSNCSRIIRTESSRIWYTGQKQIWTDNNVKELILIATLDGVTSKICRSRDGNIYKLGEEPALPFHPNERSTYGVYIEDLKPITRKDNETKQIIQNMNFNEWLEYKKI